MPSGLSAKLKVEEPYGAHTRTSNIYRELMTGNFSFCVERLTNICLYLRYLQGSVDSAASLLSTSSEPVLRTGQQTDYLSSSEYLVSKDGIPVGNASTLHSSADPPRILSPVLLRTGCSTFSLISSLEQERKQEVGIHPSPNTSSLDKSKNPRDLPQILTYVPGWKKEVTYIHSTTTVYHWRTLADSLAVP